ncbi:hypothetical protein DID78_05805 [Candidatus Marinamargulisbacteria bacterium SCGC AG-343-D04]|nr:hypothetical protein DID78_05805 [Candidatus Marinamargulisbacteria bacterium SCGC AG-343-D04]
MKKKSLAIFYYIGFALYGGVFILIVHNFIASLSIKENPDTLSSVTIDTTMKASPHYMNTLTEEFTLSKTNILLEDPIDILDPTQNPSQTPQLSKKNTVYTPPMGDGHISKTQKNSTYIEAGRILYAPLTEPLSSLQLHPIQAHIKDPILVKGTDKTLKQAIVIGQVSCDKHLNRFFIQFTDLVIGKKTHSISGHVIDDNGKRGIAADVIQSKKAEALLNSVISVAKDIVSPTNRNYLPPIINDYSPQTEHKSTAKQLQLNPTLLRIKIQFPVEIKESLL